MSPSAALGSSRIGWQPGRPAGRDSIGAAQPYTAERVEVLGLGRAIDVDERTPQVIRDRTAEVLGDPRFRRNAGAFAAEIARLPPLAHAVALVERLAVQRQPILRLD